MEAINNLIAGDLTSPVSLAILLVALLVAIILLYFLFRAIFGSVTNRQTRGRQPRLSVTDAAVVDDKRRLVLVRRDEVEHLVMIGGPSDIVVEQNIVRTGTVPAERYQRAANPIEPHPAPDRNVEPAHAAPEPKPETPPSAAGTATLAAGSALAATATQAGSSLTGIAKETTSTLADTTSASVSGVAETVSQAAETAKEAGSDSIDALKHETSQIVASVSPAGQTSPEPAHAQPPRSESLSSAPDMTSAREHSAPSVDSANEGDQKASKTEDEMQRLLDELTAEKN